MEHGRQSVLKHQDLLCVVTKQSTTKHNGSKQHSLVFTVLHTGILAGLSWVATLLQWPPLGLPVSEMRPCVQH